MKTSNYVKELREESVAALNEQLVAAKKELFNLRFQNATNQLDNTGRIKEVRKNIARIQTIITEKAKKLNYPERNTLRVSLNARRMAIIMKGAYKSWKKEILEKHVQAKL